MYLCRKQFIDLKKYFYSEINIYKTEPVASLKLYRDDTVTLGRTQCHATQVFWSQVRIENISSTSINVTCICFYLI